MQNVFPKLSATPGVVRSIAPQIVGQDNDEIYSSVLGLSPAELADLKTRGLI
jgi:formyl-CoA transferase